MCTRTGERGQGTVEYAALLALVATLIAVAAALTPGGLGVQVAYGLRRGLCAVTGSRCPSAPRDRPDLPPCPLGRASRVQDFDVALGFVKVGGALAVLRERSSDGRVTVTFTSAGRGGLTAGLGVRISLGAAPLRAEIGGDISLAFTAGRSWILPDRAAAERFVRRYGSDQTLLGRLGNDLRRVCLLCHLVGWEPGAPPAPDATYLEGGGSGQAEASVKLGLSADARAALGGAMGRRRSRDGSTTWYLRLDGAASARFYVEMGAGAGTGGAGEAELETDRSGRPRRLLVRLVRLSSTESTGPPRLALDTAPRPHLAPNPFAGRGGVVETESALDLTSPDHARAVRRFLAALRPGRGGELAASIDGLVARLRRSGTSTMRTYRLHQQRSEVGGELGTGAVVGGGYSRDDRQLDLTGVYTRLPGLGYLPRADCLAM